MSCNLCRAVHVVQPMWCIPFGAIAVQPTWRNLCCAIYMVLPMWCNIRGASYGVQPMLCNMCCAPVLCNLSCAIFVAQ
eukprot:1130993-Pyramimonas_sp.AAC.1